MEVAGGRWLGLGAILGLVGILLLALPEGGEAAAMPSLGGRNGDMRSAIKFLQDMDSYYGQIARPRFGKRGGDGLLRNERSLETMQSYEPQLMGFDRR